MLRSASSTQCPLSSVVEHLHGKEGVRGSIPREGSGSKPKVEYFARCSEGYKPDYDGGHKALVRWTDGSEDMVGGSKVERE